MESGLSTSWSQTWSNSLGNCQSPQWFPRGIYSPTPPICQRSWISRFRPTCQAHSCSNDCEALHPWFISTEFHTIFRTAWQCLWARSEHFACTCHRWSWSCQYTTRKAHQSADSPFRALWRYRSSSQRQSGASPSSKLYWKDYGQVPASIRWFQGSSHFSCLLFYSFTCPPRSTAYSRLKRSSLSHHGPGGRPCQTWCTFYRARAWTRMTRAWLMTTRRYSLHHG